MGAVVAEWLAMNRGLVDVLLVPATCCGAQVDYTQHALWAGRPWPLNVAALHNSSSSVETRVERAFMRRAAAVEEVSPQHDFVLYALYVASNNWQADAAEKFAS